MVAAVLLVASCAAYEWRNPGLTEAHWPRDEAEWVGRAAAKVEEEAARQERYGSGGGARVRARSAPSIYGECRLAEARCPLLGV